MTRESLESSKAVDGVIHMSDFNLPNNIGLKLEGIQHELSGVRVSTVAAAVRVITNISRVEKFFLETDGEAAETIPGFSSGPIEPVVSQDAQLIVVKGEVPEFKCDVDKNIVFIATPEEKLYLPDLAYLGLSMLAREMNRIDRFVLHASAVAFENKGVLLVGDSGTGKTATASYLILEKGFDFISNDRTIIGMSEGRPAILASTLDTRVRVGSVEAYFPSLRMHLEANPTLLERPWSNKIVVHELFSEMGVNVISNVPLSLVCMVNTYDADDSSTVVDPYSDDERDYARFACLGQISENVRAASNLVVTCDCPFPSFDSMELAERRLRFVNNVVDTAKFYGLRGNIRGVANKVADLLKEI